MIEKKKIILEIKTPFFIGEGEEYESIDYVLDEKFKVIDKTRFNKKVFENETLYKKFMDIADKPNELGVFFKENVNEFLYEVDISHRAKEVLSQGGSVKKFIRDKFTNEVIIPGSTIKGAIRTALANYLFHNRYYDELINENNEQKFLNKIFRDGSNNAQDDLLKTLFISDLKPKYYRLKILRPMYYINQFDEPKEMDVLEFLVEGVFEGEIYINEKLLDKLLEHKSLERLSFNLIKESLKDFYEDILNFESSRITNPIFKFPNYEEFLIKIGLHSGAGAKTIKNKRDIFVRLSNGEKFYHQPYQFSTWFDEDNNAIGWGKLEFKE
jgi:CRISPR type III-A-associated RAMP protein Csm5